MVALAATRGRAGEEERAVCGGGTTRRVNRAIIETECDPSASEERRVGCV
jgi:hypothetical protein